MSGCSLFNIILSCMPCNCLCKKKGKGKNEVELEPKDSVSQLDTPGDITIDKSETNVLKNCEVEGWCDKDGILSPQEKIRDQAQDIERESSDGNSIVL